MMNLPNSQRNFREEPFNYPPGNLINVLKAQFMATLHWEYDESRLV